PPGRRHLAVLAHDEPAHEGAARLDVLAVHSDVADLGVGHHHELALVRRVREDLLVAGHARVEDELADRLADGPEGTAAEDGAVGEREDGLALRHQDATRSVGVAGRSSYTSRPPTSTETTRPTRSQPSNGVFRPFDRKARADTFQRRSESTRVTSAAAPTASVPAGSPRSRAGPALVRDTSAGRSRTPSGTSRSPSASAVSSPTMPLAA